MAAAVSEMSGSYVLPVYAFSRQAQSDTLSVMCHLGGSQWSVSADGGATFATAFSCMASNGCSLVDRLGPAPPLVTLK